jgi:hypothetical protein
LSIVGNGTTVWISGSACARRSPRAAISVKLCRLERNARGRERLTKHIGLGSPKQRIGMRRGLRARPTRQILGWSANQKPAECAKKLASFRKNKESANGRKQNNVLAGRSAGHP